MSKRIADNKLRAFSIGKTNPIPKKGSLIKRREKEEEKKRLDRVETQHVSYNLSADPALLFRLLYIGQYLSI